VAIAVGSAQFALVLAGVPLGVLSHQLVGYWYGAAIGLAFTCVGTVVAARQPDYRMGWLMLAAGGCWCLGSPAAQYAVLDYQFRGGRLPLGWLAVIGQAFWVPAFATLASAVVLFPDGHPRSPRWRWSLRWLATVTVIAFTSTVAVAVHAEVTGTVRIGSDGSIQSSSGASSVASAFSGLLFASFAAMIVAWVAGQAISYRHLAGEPRLQQKWIISGATISLASTCAGLLLTEYLLIGIAGLPVAMGIGILKYRLYEIDKLISRTITYLIVSGLLAGIFVAIVVVMTRMLPFASPVGVAASTLAAAALFNPLRVRVQRTVDRRFNRAHYDAEAIVDAFTLRLRDAVDLDTVRGELLRAVDRAVEPAHASLWLRPPQH
jgi:hypothetical protein